MNKATIIGGWVGILVAFAVLGVVVLYLLTAEDTSDVQHEKTAPARQLVSIETRSVASETIELTTFAEVRPRWSAELSAAVSGRVEKVLETALAGEQVDAGTTLIIIEDRPYAAELASAELALKEARLVLLKAKNDTALARKQFKRDGIAAPNDLALHLPELRIAQASVTSAEAKVAAARQQLDNATIKAPFSGFVTERFVSPGQTVNTGDPLVKLVDNRTFDLTVEMGRDDWMLLQQPVAGLTAPVLGHEGKPITQARIRQAGGFLDEKTRQYKVFLEIDEPAALAVLSGDFVRVLLPGITLPKALNIPESALTQEGYVWHLDEADRLQRVTPKVLFRRQGRIVIRTPGDADTWRIATTPLASFLPGQQVHAQVAEN